MRNEFDAAVASSLQPSQGQAARVGFSVAADTNPDTYVEAQRVARRTGVPVDTALNMPKEVKRQATMGTIDFDALAKTSPATASLLADVEKAKIAHDDVDNLSSVERTLLGTAGDAYATLIKGAIGLPQAFVGLADIPTFGYVGKGLDAIGIRFNDAQKAAEELFYSDAQKQAAKKVQSAQGFTDTLSAALHNPSVIATTAGESVPQILGGASIARGLLKFLPKASSVMLGAIGEGATGAGSAAESIRSQSVDGTLSFKQSLAAVGSGVGTAAFGLAGGKVAGRLGLDDIDAALVRAGLDKGVAKAAKIGFVSKLAAGGISEGLFEELPQSAQEQMWQNYATGKPLGDGVKNAMAMGLVTGGVMGGGFQGVHHAIAKAQSAEQGTQQLARLNELASASKVLQRDPQSFEAFIEQVSEGGPVQQVFIDANTLMQSGVAEQVASVSPAVATQLAEAVQTGGQIAIPVGEYTARIAPTEYAQSLLDHLKTDPEGFSRAEAQQYMQSHADELKAEVERAAAEKQGDETFKTSADAVKESILSDLNALGRFTPAKNEADATLIASYYAVRAAQMGTTPEELFQRRQLNSAAERIDGPQFDQGGTLANLRQQWADAGIKGDVSENNGTITLSRIIVPEGERGAGKGTAAMQALVEYANRTGQHIALSPSSDFGGNKKRLVEFYKRFGFVENKGKNRAFTTSESMYRQATGKVLYQFAGQRAQGADLHALDTAKQRIAAGENPETVRRDTGWFKGNDGKWRYEISDADAKFIGKDDLEQAAEADPYKLAEMPLGDVLDHPALFAAYPKLRNITVAYEATSAAAGDLYFGASYNSVDNTISLGNGLTNEQMASALLHEIQHGIQTIEGFATGGSLEIAGIVKAQAKREWDHWSNAYTIKREMEEAGHSLDEAVAALNDLDFGINADQIADAKRYTLAELKAKNDAAYAELQRTGDGPRSTYLKIAGEVEARNTQARAGMTDEQRRATPPGATADTADHDVILVFNGKEMEHAPAIANAFNQEALGAFNPATNTITLLKGANLSTFLHESGHFFFENDLALAAELAQEAQMFGPDTINPGERQILADVSALLNWHGIQGDINAQLAQWYGLDFEEKRAYHEQTARSFEVYLWEGKAPSLELQHYFQTFRAWLLTVYKNILAAVKGDLKKGLDSKINDDVRGVFDRMLASTDEIKLAEHGRSMMPLFTSPEQAGMTPEEFKAYHDLGVEATNTAIQDLQARGLRDMKYLHGANDRILKNLQNEAKAQRDEVKIDVRREVMSQPIYRAWQFLTGKLTADDKIAPVERPKSDPDVVDPALDSLFVAIAKLGGIQRDSAAALWGVKPEDKPKSGVFGKHVLRRTGGLTVDQMAERLAELGYLAPDENGNTAIRDFEEAFHSELVGSTIYSREADYDALSSMRAGDQVVNPEALGAGRFDMGELKAMGLPVEIINALKARRMTAANGLHPDIVAEMFGFTSGDELARKLSAIEDLREAIESLADERMVEQFGDLSSPEAIREAADRAIYNEFRARFLATEANALAKATGQMKILVSAAKEHAAATIGRLKVRDVRPGQYASAEARAAKAAEKAKTAGDVAKAATEKRNQVLQNCLTKAAYDAKEEVDKGLRYLKKFEGDIKTLDADYADQIGNLLERFDLRKGQSNKAVDKRTALAEWIKAQRESGLEPDIPPELENEAFRTSYKNLTVEEFRGLVDSVRQIEHLGRLKHKLLTAADKRAYEAVRDEIAASIHQHAQGREADTRTPTTNTGRAVQGLKRFWAAHIKAATWARVMDGGKDGGPMWEYFVRSANERGDQETTMRAEATAKLSEILAPVFKLGRMGGKGQFFQSIGRSLNREARIAIALNMGNDGNTQRLLGGEGWTIQQLTPVLQSLTAQEWQAVQAVWDHFESYRPQIAAKERRVYGKEPDWVEPRPFAVTAADGTTVQMRGGYYPIKYDPAASQRAEEHADAESAKRQLQGAYTTATTRRSFTKSRVEEVAGRPLLYTLSGLYSGVNDVIHDLAWHEWLIDTNRLLRSHTIDAAIRDHYGPEVKQQFKTWAQDIAEGEKGADGAVDLALSRLRQGISASGLGFNVMSAIMQPLGITQSITRVGAQWVGRGIVKYLAAPIDLTRQVNEMSDFMANRARTRFRELNELRNQVQDQSAFKEMIGRYAYFLMMRCQQMVDVPTWWGAYEKAIAEGNEESRSVALADQAVIDAQGGGQTKDLSAIERGGPAQQLFTVFYSFMNTALNVGVEKTMSADTPAKRAKLAVDYAMLYVVPAVLGYFLKAALTPGDSGDDDPEKIAKKLAANQIDYLMGLMVVLREFSEAAKLVSGSEDKGRDYTGPAGLRLVADAGSLAKQAHQGEFDDAFRKAAVNVVGDMFGLPSAQINRTITGAKSLADGKTENPAALVFGFQKKR